NLGVFLVRDCLLRSDGRTYIAKSSRNDLCGTICNRSVWHLRVHPRKDLAARQLMVRISVEGAVMVAVAMSGVLNWAVVELPVCIRIPVLTIVRFHSACFYILLTCHHFFKDENSPHTESLG